MMCEDFFAVISAILILYVFDLQSGSIFRSQRSLRKIEVPLGCQIALRFILFPHSIWTMEFFFLTQNNTVEILVLIALLLILMVIWGHDLYSWVGRIKTVFSMGSRRISDVPHNIEKIEPNTVVSRDREPKNENNIDTNTYSPASANSIEPMVDIPKIDTSNVEKLT